MDKLSVLFVCECVCLSSPLAPSVLHGRGPRPLRVTPQALGIRPTFPHSAAWGNGVICDRPSVLRLRVRGDVASLNNKADK